MARGNDGPIDAFRQVTAAAMRAIAHQAELSVTFVPEGAGLRGTEARLPLPSRDLPADEVAVVRGEADAISLKLRHHDDAAHAQRRPSGTVSRAIFDAAEQARCEAIGAKRMHGVHANLKAALEERCRTQGFARMVERETAPLAEVVALIAREAIMGDAPPAAAKRMVDAWRPWIESRAGADFAGLGKLINDQDAFAAQVRRLIQDLDLGENDQAANEPDDEQGKNEENNDGAESGQRGEGMESATDAQMGLEAREAGADESATPRARSRKASRMVLWARKARSSPAAAGARTVRSRTSPSSRPTAPSPPSSTKSSRPTPYVTLMNLRGCGSISTNS
jgi:cobaltochelatase CobT